MNNTKKDYTHLYTGEKVSRDESNKPIRQKRGHTMVITDIKVRKLFDEGPMKAIVSVTFDGQLALHDIKVISVRDKNFIVMPSRKNPDGTYRDIAHPINAEFRGKLEEEVLRAYEDELARAAAEAEAEAIEANV